MTNYDINTMMALYEAMEAASYWRPGRVNLVLFDNVLSILIGAEYKLW